MLYCDANLTYTVTAADQSYRQLPDSPKNNGVIRWVQDRLRGVYCVDAHRPGEYLLHSYSRFLSSIADKPLHVGLQSWPVKRNEPKVADYILLYTGVSQPTRSWPEERFAELVRRIRNAAPDQVIALGAGPGERGRYPNLTEVAMHHERVLDHLGTSGFDNLLTLVANATAVISNDTGPAHLAVMMHKPTIVLAGGGHFGYSFPPPDSGLYLDVRYHRLPCYHCYHCRWTCTEMTAGATYSPCLEAISVDEVFEAAVRIGAVKCALPDRHCSSWA